MMKPSILPATVPASKEPEVLARRFRKFSFRDNPLESPMAQALLKAGYEVKPYPLLPQYTDADWFACSVIIKGLIISFRHPTPKSLYICLISRVDKERSLASSLMGIVRFFSILRDDCPEVLHLGGHILKNTIKDEGDMPLARLLEFYDRLLGGSFQYWLEEDRIGLYTSTKKEERFHKYPLWARDTPRLKETLFPLQAQEKS